MATVIEVRSRNGTILTGVLLCDWRYYLLDHVRLLMISDTVAYCRECQTFVAAENLRTPAQCAASIRSLLAFIGDDHDQFEFLLDPTWIDDYRANIRMLRARQSPPRCLECGSLDIMQAETDEQGDTTGRLNYPDHLPPGALIGKQYHVSTNSYYRLYSAEGEELPLFTGQIQEIVERRDR